MRPNPLFETWTTPFGLPPFDRIRSEHFPPAYDREMQDQSAEIAAIVGAVAAPSSPIRHPLCAAKKHQLPCTQDIGRLRFVFYSLGDYRRIALPP
jgi:hypothetical protein